MADYRTLVTDINAMLASAEGTSLLAEAAEAAAVKAGTAVAEGLIRATSGKRNFAPRARWGQLWATDLGKPCHRQTYYKVAGVPGDPVPVGEEDDGPNGRFLLGDVLEAATMYLVRAAGHSVGNEGERIAVMRNGWEISGKRDCTIDGWSVDVKSASQFAFSKYKREGVVPGNDTFGYAAQPDFYQAFGGEDGKYGSALLFAEKGSLAMHSVEFPMGIVLGDPLDRSEQRIESLTDELTRAHQDEVVYGPGNAGFNVPRVERVEMEHEKKGKIYLQHKACEYCEFRQRCLFDQGAVLAGTEVGKKKVTYFKVEPTGGY